MLPEWQRGLQGCKYGVVGQVKRGKKADSGEGVVFQWKR